MSGFLIYHYRVTDRERINQLGSLSTPIVEKYQGKLLVASTVTALEGSPFTHMVVYQFASQQQAQAFYDSAESQQLAKFRNEVTEGFAVIVPQYCPAT